jgi:crossover junction endodeoxyribonuclease RusA
MVESSKAVKPWRQDIRAHLLNGDNTPLRRFDGPVTVQLGFLLRRPKSTPKRVVFPAVRPDIDKLARAVLDAITSAGVIVDDSRVVSLSVTKRYDDRPGVRIWIDEETE